MVNTVNTALSGLAAAAKRLETSAQNTVNARSTRSLVDGNKTDAPYKPQKVVQSSLSTGGVIAKTADVEPATVKLFDPSSDSADENGIATLPNVNLEAEAVNQIIAAYDYKANLKAIKVQADLEKDFLLNIKS